MFLAFLGLTGTIIYNALYLQDLHSTSPRRDNAAGGARELVGRDGDAAAGEHRPATVGRRRKGGPELVVRAVQRELATRGFDVGPADGKPSDKTKCSDLGL